MKKFFLLLFFVIGCVKLTAQQLTDTLYNPSIYLPQYKNQQYQSEYSIVNIQLTDEAHTAACQHPNYRR